MHFCYFDFYFYSLRRFECPWVDRIASARSPVPNGGVASRRAPFSCYKQATSSLDILDYLDNI